MTGSERSKIKLDYAGASFGGPIVEHNWIRGRGKTGALKSPKHSRIAIREARKLPIPHGLIPDLDGLRSGISRETVIVHAMNMHR